MVGDFHHTILQGLRSIRDGDFSMRVNIMDFMGIEKEIAQTFNEVSSMHQLLAFEIERVGVVVGQEGTLDERLSIPNALGSWSECVENLNNFISNIVRPTTEVVRVIEGLAEGDLSQKIHLESHHGATLHGEFFRTAEVVNNFVDQLNTLASEVTRVASEIGSEGKFGGQMDVKGVRGTWKRMTDNVNAMSTHLTHKFRTIAEVTTAVVNGDLSEKVTLNVKGETLELKNTINAMMDQLKSFGSEVTRLSHEMGIEGKLGRQIEVKGVSGTWKDVTDNVNKMAANLTGQLRAITEVATAVSKGDFTRSIVVEASSEVGTLRNTINKMITNLKESAQSMTVAKEAARSASRIKSQFMANMSHEIRTPMHGIIGMTELTMDTELMPEQREYLELVLSSANGLLTIINDILDFSKIEVGQLRLESKEFNLRAAIYDTLKTLALPAHQKQLELICDIHPDVPNKLVGDPNRLRQVLANLIGNAIKFTHVGEVALSVEMENLLETTCTLHFSVRDTGIGIPKDKLSVIFEAFSQVDGSITRKYGGTGLGLTLSTRLVDLMQGQFSAESVPDQGSTFHFTACFSLTKPVPLGAPLSAAHFSPSLETIPMVPTSLVNLPVLAVDDNASNRKALDTMLSSLKMQVSTAENGETAMDMLRAAVDNRTPYQLILLDEKMPVLDGFKVAELIKQEPHLSQGARVVVMASAEQLFDSPQNEKCASLGISACITKPVSHIELIHALQQR
eukprot:TRINITY_DN1697_c0_g1_i10.p1 TRINITY_DN1697_c0_g1~~TRINITY_DN1697_c0_g1_i10.p1  ORF type:complete len:736 (+),score=153.04 TRINITY_DN1697_c0_g1_i10:1594-3801(+)